MEEGHRWCVGAGERADDSDTVKRVTKPAVPASRVQMPSSSPFSGSCQSLSPVKNVRTWCVCLSTERAKLDVSLVLV